MKEIVLRAVEPEDVEFMYECENDRQNALWSDYKAPLSKSQLTEYALSYDADPFKSGQLRLIIEQHGNSESDSITDRIPVGILDLYQISAIDSKGFIGICIHPEYRRRGIAKEAITKLLEFNRERLGLKMLIAKVSVINQTALQLFEHSGFTPIALLPAWHRIGSELQDFHLLIKTARGNR